MCSSLNGAVVWSVSLSLKCVMFAKQVSQQKTLPVYQPRLIQQLCLLFLWQEKSLPFNPPSLSHLLSCFSSLTLSHEFVSLGGKSVRLLQPWVLALIPAVTTCTANAHPPTLHQQTRGMIYYRLKTLAGQLNMKWMNPIEVKMNPSSHFKLLSPVWSLWNELSSGCTSTTTYS